LLLGGNSCDVMEITSCYANWRAEEALYAEREREADTNPNPEQTAREQAIAESSNPNPDPDPDNTGDALTLAVPDVCPPSSLSPSLVYEAIVSLVGGYGELNNIILPSDTPLGRYVIEVSDGVNIDSLRVQEPASKPNLNPHPEFNSTANPPKATVTKVKDLVSLVNHVRTSTQIIFTAVASGVPDS
jgi:hypothetical protein